MYVMYAYTYIVRRYGLSVSHAPSFHSSNHSTIH